MCKSIVVLLVFLVASVAHAHDDSMKNPRVQAALRAMENTSTWYHDDLFGEIAGFKNYARHRYTDALRYFDLGAYYADKPAQLSIGLMYLKGEGVARDDAAAYAWIDLSAERGYPAYVATRDRVRATLTLEQLLQSVQIRKKLAARYGDEVAKPRIANELRTGLSMMTGSRAGFDNGVKFLPLDAIDPVHASAASSGEVTTICAQGFWAAECWHPNLYFAMRDRQLNETVTVGTVEDQRKSADGEKHQR
jgi:hypothetical protein